MSNCGIYLLTHIESNRHYVGQSINIKNRLVQHKNSKNKTRISNAIAKYGFDSFSVEILELCNKDNLNDREVYWVTHHNCVHPNGFNLTSGGGYNTIFSDETKAKIAEANRHRVISEETRNKMRNAQSNRTQEHRQKIGESNKGKKITDSHKALLLEYAVKNASVNIKKLAKLNTGSKRTPEVRAKMSQKQIGRKYSPETIAKMSASQKAITNRKPLTEEQRKNLSNALIGHKHSPETLAKLSESAKKRGKETYERLTAAKLAKKQLLANSVSSSAC